MSGLGRWEQSSAGETRLNVRISDELKESFREWCDEEGITMTEGVIEAVEERIDRRTTEEPPWLPDDDDLADAWRVLDRHVRNDQRRIDVQLAITLLADTMNVPKQAVKTSLLLPLEHHDPQLAKPVNGVLFIRPRPGEIEEPEPAEQDGAEIDREEIRETMEELADAEPVEPTANHHETNG